jgi:hypothetical protein
MEDLDEKTIAELKAKAIERGGDDDLSTNEIDEDLKDTASETEEIIIPVKDVKKPKRQRSEKQIAAFEKARIKRAENLKIKKQIEAEKKAEIQEEKQQVKLEVKKRLEKKQVSEGAELTETPSASARHNPTRPKDVHRFAGDIYDSQEQPYQRVVNNYYYYGATPSGAMQWQDPHQHAQEYYEPPAPKPRRQKIKPPPEPEPEPLSDEEYSDVEEPQSYKELQNYEQEEIIYQPNNGLKFRFA